MNQEEIVRILKANVGKVLDIIFDGNRTTTVTVSSVDHDGVLCRLLGVKSQQPSEFWVAFEHIQEIKPSH
jgi:hypothetical protein